MKDIWAKWWWLIILIGIKLGLQLGSAGNYGFHRDEFLYLAQSDHLAWGYLEVPPLLAALGAFIKLFGSGIYWVKLFPALFGGVSMWLIAMMTKDLGGNRRSQALACIAFLVVPAYLRTHHLFQPVFLNQFMWLALCFLVVRLIHTGKGIYWYWLGAIIGLGILTKYSIAFPVAGLLVGLLFTEHRKWLIRREPYLAAALTLCIAAPNLYWQYAHNFPIIAHMEELRKTQLVNVSVSGFLIGQFIMLFSAGLLWLPGLVALFTPRFKKFQILGWIYVTVIILLLVTSGKAYYSLGIYPMLIAAGAIWWQNILERRSWLRIGLPALIVAGSLGSIPFGIPILPIDTMVPYGRWMADNMGLGGLLVWEDGKTYTIPQDYADMYGWEEMVANVAQFYHSLSPEDQASCNFWGGSYGHAGALLHYADKYDIPKDVTSFNGSFALWAKDEADFERQIEVDDRLSLESEYFNTVTFVDSTRNVYARDGGYITYKTQPAVDIPTAWRLLVKENKARWRRN